MISNGVTQGKQNSIWLDVCSETDERWSEVLNDFCITDGYVSRKRWSCRFSSWDTICFSEADVILFGDKSRWKELRSCDILLSTESSLSVISVSLGVTDCFNNVSFFCSMGFLNWLRKTFKASKEKESNDLIMTLSPVSKVRMENWFYPTTATLDGNHTPLKEVQLRVYIKNAHVWFDCYESVLQYENARFFYYFQRLGCSYSWIEWWLNLPARERYFA